MSKIIMYSENTRAVDALRELLLQEGFDTIEHNDRIAFCGVDPDAEIQLINAGINFEAAAKLAEKLNETTPASVILLCNSSQAPERCDALRAAGVLIAEKPLSRQLFTQTLHDAVAQLGKLRSTMQLLNETRRIDRAKLMLIENRHISEQDAHRYIEKQAMDRRITRLQVANDIISRLKA